MCDSSSFVKTEVKLSLSIVVLSLHLVLVVSLCLREATYLTLISFLCFDN